jgi:hypothetical protein
LKVVPAKAGTQFFLEVRLFPYVRGAPLDSLTFRLLDKNKDTCMERSIGRALLSAAVGLTCLLGAAAASAQQGRLEQAANILERQARAGKGEFIMYLTGAATAYRWASAAEGGARTFCPPADVTLEGRTYARIALEEYRRDRSAYAKLPDFPLEVLALALMRGLGAKFPCLSDEPAEAAASPAAASAALEPH